MQRKKHHRMVQLKNPADVAQTAVRSMPYSHADLHLHTVFSDGLMTPEETGDLIAALIGFAPENLPVI